MPNAWSYESKKVLSDQDGRKNFVVSPQKCSSLNLGVDKSTAVSWSLLLSLGPLRRKGTA